MKVEYYLCISASLKNFSYGSKYIRVRNSNFKDKGIYLNGSYELECVNDSFFTTSENKLSVMDVYAIYSSKDGSIIAGKKYGVYKVNSDNYYNIFTEKFVFKYFPNSWFISYEEWIGFNDESFKKYCNEHREYCQILDHTSTRSESQTETAKLEKEKKEKKAKIDLINNVSKTIAKNTGVSVTTTVSKMPKSVFWLLLSIVALGIVFCIATKNALFAIIAFWTFITAMIGRKKEEVLIDKEIEVDLQNYERLNAMNKLPLNMLGKIQQLQNYMTIMRYRKVSEDIIGLVEQSVNLTVFTTIQDDYYSSNKEEIDKRLNEFLDNTLEYVKTSLQNKDMEIYQIKKNLSQDYLQMIDKNSEMFKSITKDLEKVSNIFEENKEETETVSSETE